MLSSHLESHVIPPSKQTEKPRNDLKHIGKNMLRVEDPRLLTGKGRYVDDIVLPNMAHAAVLRSPYAHAKIQSIDTSKAERMPGVVIVMTGRDVAEVTGPLPTFSSPPVTQRCVALERVRHVGETVAVVVAEDRYIAEDALERIEVVYEELPAVVDAKSAISSRGDSVLHPELGDTNVAIDKIYSYGPVDEDFARADRVVQRRIRWGRSGSQPLETVGAVAEFDESYGKFTVHANSSMYNYVGWLCAASLNVAASQLNIVPVSAGGSFGSKLFTHKNIVLACTLARAAGRPVKLVEDRLDNMLSADAHGSDRMYDAELALKADGTMLSLRFDVIDDYGAYLQFGVGTHGNALSQCIGPYRINSFRQHLIAVLTNKCQQGAYRGFGSEVMNFALERMVDAAADELGLDRIDIRCHNLIQKDQFPYVIPSGNIYDSGNYPAVLDKAIDLLDYDGWRARQREARAGGRYIGIGLTTCQERSVFSATEFWSLNATETPGFTLTSAPESIAVKIDPTGKILAKINAPFWGNSPETVVTQILAEQFSIDPAEITVTYADSDSGFNSTGPGGSRFTVMVAGAAVKAAGAIKAKVAKVAAHMLEANPADIEFRDGKVGVKGDPSSEKALGEVALMSHYFRLSFPDEDGGFDSGLDAAAVYDHPMTTLPAADRSHLGIFYPIMGHMAHFAVVEVDIETGRVSFLDYVAVHDCGTVVNPATLDGHIRGGTAMGIGSALYESFEYNENGQLVTASFADYHMPSVNEVPRHMKIGHIETPSPYTEYGIKGGGEGGRMASPAAIVSAVEDALRPLGVKIDGIPLTPQRLRRLIREAETARRSNVSSEAAAI